MAGEHQTDDADKFPLIRIQERLRFSRNVIGDALVKEGLLALQEIFLIAEGANREPRQRETGRDDSEQEYQGNFFHSNRASCCFPILALVMALVKPKVSSNLVTGARQNSSLPHE